VVGRGTAAGKSRKTRLSSVANAMRVVKAFSDDEYEIGISNLARRLALPKSTVHRLAATLVDAEFLEKNPETGGYRGLALFDLGMLVRRKMNVVTEARPYLRALMERTGESVHLTVLDHASVLYVNNITSAQAIRMQSNLRARVPAHCCSEGKALLAFRPATIVDSVIAAGLAARTPKTIVTPQRLRDELTLARGRGYALDDEELEIGLRAARRRFATIVGTSLRPSASRVRCSA
jgi:DNA-binding IclR family transcriptional regulator